MLRSFPGDDGLKVMVNVSMGCHRLALEPSELLTTNTTSGGKCFNLVPFEMDFSAHESKTVSMGAPLNIMLKSALQYFLLN